LKAALVSYAVEVQANQQRSQLTITLNRGPSCVVDYSKAFSDIKLALSNMKLSGIEIVKVFGRVESSRKPEYTESFNISTSTIWLEEPVNLKYEFHTELFELERFQQILKVVMAPYKGEIHVQQSGTHLTIILEREADETANYPRVLRKIQSVCDKPTLEVVKLSSVETISVIGMVKGNNEPEYEESFGKPIAPETKSTAPTTSISTPEATRQLYKPNPTPQRTLNQQSAVRCPKCRSTEYTANKAGFSWGRAVGGAVLFGPLGLAGGFTGNKVWITCLSCGHKWQPGQ